MSSFCGIMKEYLDVSIDRFDGPNLDSTVYFLSHKHEDHMVGLASRNLTYRLESNSHIKLYCSEVTRDLLLVDDRFKSLTKSLVVLDVEVPCAINVPDPTTGKTKYNVTVTAIQAGHCPGSVMFLFEGEEGTALYTGDFRLARGDVSRIESLKSGNSVKSIDSLYIDTTFCVPEAYFIPSREDSTEAIIDTIESWISTSPRHMVLLNYKAALGYEHLFIEIVSHLQSKIHLSDRKFKECKAVAAFPDFGTSNGSSTQIHACKWSEVKKRHSYPLPCGHLMPASSDGPLHVKTITVSTMWFTQQVGMEDLVVIPKKNRPKYVRACYSFHSSYSEVRDVVMYLQPRRVFPNVIPMGHNEKQIQDRLNSFLQIASSIRTPATPSKPRLLGKQKSPRKRPISLNCSQSTDSDLIFDDTPKKKPKITDTGDDKGDDLFIRWSRSQSSEEPSSQPMVNGSGDHGNENGDNHSEVSSNYVGSQKSSSAMDLAASDFDLTPKKTPKKSDSMSDDKESAKQTVEENVGVCETSQMMNGSIHEEGGGGSEELFSDIDDEEVRSSRGNFKPFKDGSFGSHVSYASDVEIVYSDDSNQDDSEETQDPNNLVNGLGENKDEHNTSREKLEGEVANTSNATNKDTLEMEVKGADEQLVNNINGVVNHDQEDGHDKSLSIIEDEDDDDDIIMLGSEDDSDDVIEGSNTEETVDEASIVEDNPSALIQPQTDPPVSESESQEIIDLTADDDEEPKPRRRKKYSPLLIPRKPAYKDDCDGYHGDSESEADNPSSSTVNNDSDSSFTKASFEKTKKRLTSGKSRRSTPASNSYSSSDSDSESDGEVSKSPVTYKHTARFPIAGSSHYSTTRLNGFHQTLREEDVIILDEEEDVPPNVTVAEATEKDKELLSHEATMASAEDLVSDAMELASAAKAAAASTSPCKQSPAPKHKVVNHSPKAVLVSVHKDMTRRTARKSTSGVRLSPRRWLGVDGLQANDTTEQPNLSDTALEIKTVSPDKALKNNDVCENETCVKDDRMNLTQNDSGKEMGATEERDKDKELSANITR